VEDDVNFTRHCFNANSTGIDHVWTEPEIRHLIVGTMLLPSDTHGRLSKDPGVYVVHDGLNPGKKIGLINLTRRSSQLPPDIGFRLLPDYQSKGYGTEAALRIMRYWKDGFGVKEICGLTTERNLPSMKVLAKIGLVEGGWVSMDGQRELAFALPGMRKIDGTTASFLGKK
jgi:hypothetical protein